MDRVGVHAASTSVPDSEQLAGHKGRPSLDDDDVSNPSLNGPRPRGRSLRHAGETLPMQWEDNEESAVRMVTGAKKAF